MIEIENLRKSFRVYKSRAARLRSAFGMARESVDYEVVDALKNISISVPSGRVHGIIGMNGAGKSTLLKVLTGVLDPTSGRFRVSGRVSALLELGTGFHGELSGRDNIYLNGSIMGFSRAQLDGKIEAIQDFAELGAFFDRPVRIYSSGMYVRLAFAFAIAIEPEVLIIDEALSVGDAYFQQKCLSRIREFREQGVTILFVSHDLSAVKMLCDEVSLMSEGQILRTGSPTDMLELYNALLSKHIDVTEEGIRALEEGRKDQGVVSGTREVTIEKVRLCDETGAEAEAFVSGHPVTIEIEALVREGGVEDLVCGVLLKDRLGYEVFGTNSWYLNRAVQQPSVGKRLTFRYSMPLNLGRGAYTVTVALHSSRTHLERNYHWIERAALLDVVPRGDFEFIGVARLEPSLTIS